MTLSILNTIIDEEVRTPATPAGTPDEHDVLTAIFDASAFKTALNAIAGLTFVAGPTGFPQYAEKTNFVSSTITSPVTNYFLTGAPPSGSTTPDPLPAAGTATLLSVGGTTIFLFPTSNPDIIVGRVGNEGGANPDTANASGAVAFVIGLEENMTGNVITSADMWIALYAPITHPNTGAVDAADQLNLADLVYLGSTYDTTTNIPFENFNGVAPGNNLFNVIFPSDGSQAVQLLLTGSDDDGLSTVNVSSTGIGAGSQHIDVGASLRIDTVQGMTQANVDEAKEVNDPTKLVYADTNDADSDARVELVGADFEVTQINPGNSNERVTVKVSAFNVAGSDQGQTYLNNINSNGTAVQIDADDVIVLNGAGQPATGVTVTQDPDDPYSVIITGLDDGATNSTTDGYQVFFTTDGVRFDRFLITNMDGDDTTLDIGNLHVTAVQGGSNTEYAEAGSHLRFQDDGPLITAVPSTTASITHDETAGVQGDTDSAGTAYVTGNSGPNIASLFTGVGATQIGFARSVNPLVTVMASDAGSDGAASPSLTHSLSVSAGTPSGVSTTSGTQIFMYNGSGPTEGLVLGRIGTENGATDTADPAGAIAFALAVNATSGEVFLAQYASLRHPTAGSTAATFDEQISLNSGAVQMSVTLTDGDTDPATDSGNNIGQLIRFDDDGPAITPQPAMSATPNNLVVDNDLGDAADSTDSSSYGLLPGADGQASFSIVGPPDTAGAFRWSYFDWDNSGSAGTNEIKGTYTAGTTTTDLYKLIVNSDGTYAFTMIGAIPGTLLPLTSEEIKAGGPNSEFIDVGIAGADTRFVRIGATGGPVNESNDNVGVTNGNFDSGEALTFTFMNGSTQLSFLGMNIGTKSASGGTYGWSATPAAGGAAITGSSSIFKNGTIIVDTGGVLVNSITITKTSGSTTKIGLDDIDILVPPNDVTLSFDVRLTDGDSDFANQSFTVSIDGDNNGSISNPVTALSGTSEADLALMATDPLDTLSPFATHHQVDILLMS